MVNRKSRYPTATRIIHAGTSRGDIVVYLQLASGYTVRNNNSSGLTNSMLTGCCVGIGAIALTGVVSDLSAALPQNDRRPGF